MRNSRSASNSDTEKLLSRQTLTSSHFGQIFGSEGEGIPKPSFYVKKTHKFWLQQSDPSFALEPAGAPHFTKKAIFNDYPDL